MMGLSTGGLYLFKQYKKDSPLENTPSNNWPWQNDWKSKDHVAIPPRTQQLTASSYEEGLQLAGKEGMPVLLFFHSESCTWCKKMERETFPDPTVKNLMANYVFVSIDTDKDKKTTKEYAVNGIPAYAITNANKEHLKFGDKFIDAKGFAVWLDNPNLYKQPKVEKPKSEVKPPPDLKKPDDKKKPRKPGNS